MQGQLAHRGKAVEDAGREGVQSVSGQFQEFQPVHSGEVPGLEGSDAPVVEIHLAIDAPEVIGGDRSAVIDPGQPGENRVAHLRGAVADGQGWACVVLRRSGCGVGGVRRFVVCRFVVRRYGDPCLGAPDDCIGRTVELQKEELLTLRCIVVGDVEVDLCRRLPGLDRYHRRSIMTIVAPGGGSSRAPERDGHCLRACFRQRHRDVEIAPLALRPVRADIENPLGYRFRYWFCYRFRAPLAVDPHLRDPGIRVPRRAVSGFVHLVSDPPFVLALLVVVVGSPDIYPRASPPAKDEHVLRVPIERRSFRRDELVVYAFSEHGGTHKVKQLSVRMPFRADHFSRV